MKRKFLAVLLALLMVLSLVPTILAPQTAVAESGPIDQAIVQGGAILHCFDWSFDEIREALPDIKAAGYAAVQTSPVQPPKDYNASWNDTSGNWWKLYQPLDFCVVGENGSWLGSKADLTALCNAAADEGIYVIVDVVANHTANITGGGYTVNGTYNVSDQVAERLQDPDGSKNLYHTSENGTNDGSRFTMTQYHLSMPDLNTGNRDVQNMVLDFLKECVDCGVDGFRFDAAKHIELPGDDGCGSDFWPYILNGVRDYAGANNLYIYGESLSGSGSDAWVNEFITYMGLTDSQAGNTARGAVVDQNAGLLAVSDYTRGNSPKDYVIWAESHDTYEDGGSTGVSSAKIIKTWGIVGARADSTALFLARPNERMGLASTDTAWKSPAVAAVNAFKNHYDGKGEWLSYDQDAKITWVERGTSGGDAGVSIVKLDGAGSVNLDAHLMSSGYYLDEITGNVFTVSGGKISGTVGTTGVAVVYQPTAEPSASPSPSSEPTTRTLYLKPNSGWKQDGARFAMYSWGSGEHWTSMTRVDGETEDIYEAELPSGDTSVIFCRMNPATTDNNWNNKWNQTGDLAVPSDKNLFTLAEGVWDGATTTWSAYGDVGGGDPTPVTEDEGYYLVGTMTGWSIAPELKMTRTGAETEEYMIEVPLMRTSKPYNSQFKIVYSPDGITDQTWFPSGFDNNYGDYTGEIPQSGVYTVYFRPNYDGGSDWHDGCIYAERTKFFVTVNDTDKNGTVTVDKDVAAAGETVTVTVTPNEGYELDTLVYMCETGFNTGEFDITEIEGNTFEMPAENAAVKATFREAATAEPSFGTHALVLDGQIGVKFYMNLDCLTEEEKAASYMTFTISGAGEVSSDQVPFDAGNTNAKSTLYGFACYVNAIQMADTITATFHYGEEQTISEDYSIMQYYEAFKEHADEFDEETRNLVRALVCYGYCTQEYLTEAKNLPLGYDEASYAPIVLPGELAEMVASYDYATIVDIIEEDSLLFKINNMNDENINGISFSVAFDSETKMTVTFKPDPSYTGIATCRIDNANEAEMQKVRGRFVAEVPNIPAHKLGEMHLIWVFTDDNCYAQVSNESTMIDASPMSYVYLMLTQGSDRAKDCGAALYTYWQAAQVFKNAN